MTAGACGRKEFGHTSREEPVEPTDVEMTAAPTALRTGAGDDRELAAPDRLPLREPRAPVLSDILVARAREAHRAAAPLVRALARGRLDRAAYVLHLGGLLRVYAALEDGLLRRRESPLVAPLVVPALFRAPQLAADLAHLLGPAWQDRVPDCPAADRYAARLDRLAARAPHLLVAHACVRYLGDLAGGEPLRARLARTLDLSEGSGLSFWDVPELPDAPTREAALRARVDALPAGPVAAAAIADEAVAAVNAGAGLFAAIACP